MAILREIEKRIEKKQAELTDLQRQVTEATAYIQAMQDVLKLHSKDGENEAAPPKSLREGSDMSKVRDMILKEGRPLHITEILRGLGKEDTKSNRTSTAGSLGAYARKNRIFTRARAANTFSLIETEESKQGPLPPPTFGVVSNTQKVGA